MEDNSLGNEISIKLKSSNIFVKRSIAFFIDLIIFAMFPISINIIENIIGTQIISSGILFYLVITLYLFKDAFNKNGSFGKTLMKIKIKDISTNKRNFIFRKILRNLTNFIWPVEVIVIIITKTRISDFLFKFQVVVI